MCRHIHTIIDIQEIKDEHVSFGDLMKFLIKGQEKVFFFSKGRKRKSTIIPSQK